MNVNKESWNQKESDWIIKEETLYLGEERLHPDEENWILQEESFHDGEERKLIGELTQTQKLNEQKKNLNCPLKADTTRASAASGKAGARNTRDKSQEWDLKGMRSGD